MYNDSEKLATRIEKWLSVWKWRALGVVVGTIITLATVYKVDEGERAVILRNGATAGVAEPGINFKVPFIDSIVMMPVRMNNMKLADVQAFTKDQQIVSLEINLNWRIIPTAVDIAYASFRDPDEIKSITILPLVMERAKAVIGKYTAPETVSNRTQMNNEITTAIIDGLSRTDLVRYVAVSAVMVGNIDFTDAYEAANDAAARSEAESKTARNELAKLEISAQQQIVTANAAATAKRATADAEAYAIKAKGDADAAAVKALADVLRNNPEVIKYRATERWGGNVPTHILSGQPVPFIDVK